MFTHIRFTGMNETEMLKLFVVVFNLAGLQPQAPIHVQNLFVVLPSQCLLYVGCCHDFVQSHSDESIRFCFTTPVDVL